MSELSNSENQTRLNRRQILKAGVITGGGLAASVVLAACGGNAGGNGTGGSASTQTTSGGTSGGTTTTTGPTSPLATGTACVPCKTGGKSPVSTTAAAATPTTNPNSAIVKGAAIVPTPRKDTIIVTQGVGEPWGTFNSFIPNGENYTNGFGQIVKEYLFYQTFVSDEIKPWLGKDWKYNSDYTELTLTLNPKAHWNDGKPFTSKDVKFTIEMLMKHKAMTGAQTYVEWVKKVTAPDDHTVKFTLKKPGPRFHFNFICGIIGAQLIVPEHIWSKQDPMKFKNNPPVFTGPYKLKRADQPLSIVIWEKDPNYWAKDMMDPQAPYVVFLPGPPADLAFQQFKRNQIDVGGIDYTHAVALKNQGNKNVDIVTAFRDPCPRGTWINCDASKGILAEPKFRWVISYLIDREKIAKNIWVPPSVPTQFPWADYKSNEKWSNQEIANKYKLTYDPKKAESLLDELGAKKGSDGKRTWKGKKISIEITNPGPADSAVALRSNLLAKEMTKVGIDAKARVLSGSVYWDNHSKGKFDVAVDWLCGEVIDPYQLYSQFLGENAMPIGTKSTAGNDCRLKDDEFDKLINQIAKVAPDDPKAKDLYDKALERYYQLLPVIPEIQTTYASIFNTSVWTNWPTNDNLYAVPANWWGQFMFDIGNVKRAGG